MSSFNTLTDMTPQIYIWNYIPSVAIIVVPSSIPGNTTFYRKGIRDTPPPVEFICHFDKNHL
jgi:hypothetical protein